MVMTMKKQFRWALVAISLFGLAGCGLKGPLYFPPADAPAASKSQPDTQTNAPAANQGANTPSNIAGVEQGQ